MGEKGAVSSLRPRFWRIFFCLYFDNGRVERGGEKKGNTVVRGKEQSKVKRWSVMIKKRKGEEGRSKGCQMLNR